mgnify:CR=1 FL=1
MPNIQLYTPRDENLSAGMVCFDVKGSEARASRKARFSISASSLQRLAYRVSYARLACSVVIYTPQEVDDGASRDRDLA